MNFKKILSLVLSAVLCLTLFSSCGESSDSTPSTTTPITTQGVEKTIVVMGENENLGFWGNLKKGAEDAAKKYGYTLTYMGTDEGETDVVSTHILNLEKALTDDVSAIVVVPNSEGYSDIYGKLYDKKIPLVQIDSVTDDDLEKLEGNNKNPIVSTVSTSYEEAGALCAEKLFERVKEDIKNTNNTYLIGVIERNDKDVDEAKAKGFIDKFTELADADENTKGKYKIEVESEEKHVDSLRELAEDNARAVFITHSDVADTVSDVVFAETEKYGEMVFCGFDSGAKQIKWLTEENGAEFIGAVAQDSYNLGYNAVEQCVFAIEGKEVKSEVKIEGHWYDKNNVDKMKQDSLIFEK